MEQRNAMTLHCPHCNAEHELKQPGEQVCAACGKGFTVEGQVNRPDVSPAVGPSPTGCRWLDRMIEDFWISLAGE